MSRTQGMGRQQGSMMSGSQGMGGQQGSMMSSQNTGGQQQQGAGAKSGSQMSGSTMSAQQPFPGSEEDLKHNTNEYREDPNYSKYPFNRFTT